MTRTRDRSARSVGAASQLLLLALLLALGVGCLVSANNRLAENHDHVGALGTLAFGPAIKATRALYAIQAKNGADAERLAAQALLGEPLDQRTIATLATGALLQGDGARADTAFRAAAQLGWRDRMTQRYWLLASLDAGQAGLAAQRADALMRAHPLEPGDHRALQALVATFAGRRALLARMRQEPGWLDEYLTQTAELGPDALPDRLTMLRLAHRGGISFSPKWVAVTASRLARRDQMVAGNEIWRMFGQTDGNGDAYVAQGGFEGLASIEGQSPFAWRIATSSSLSPQVAAAPSPLDGHALRLSPTSTAPAVAAVQTILLPPGQHELRWRIAGANQPGQARPVLRCVKSNKRVALSPVSSPPATMRVKFSIPENGSCAAQRFTILATPSAAQIGTPFWIDDIHIIG